MTNKVYGMAVFLFVVMFVIAPAGAVEKSGVPVEPSFEDRIRNDSRAVQISRQSLADIVAFMHTRPDLFPPEADDTAGELITREQRLAIWNTWQAFLDHILALDSLGQVYEGFREYEKDDHKKAAFRFAYAIFLA